MRSCIQFEGKKLNASRLFITKTLLSAGGIFPNIDCDTTHTHAHARIAYRTLIKQCHLDLKRLEKCYLPHGQGNHSCYHPM